ncbi:TetR/AcrR family transcriptional regulator [Kribbella kalugense]|uniref:TetR/AcrR family transcriptional regulator n=1 Tax=Kribbella kalugense TaxID=2512221 RepID=UPI001EE01FA3|nr:TetR/AcrR family transcriptional regulator [Kribbella kalugense]
MSRRDPAEAVSAPSRAGRRREAVLDSVLATFARFGYQKTSLSEVARAAGVSRPTLYSWFEAKDELFRAAVEQSLSRDLAACERALSDSSRRLDRRVLDAFDHWAGRYVGPMTREIPVLIEASPELLGPVATAAPGRFERLLAGAVAEALDAKRARAVTQTLISTSIGIKHQTDSREEYRRRMTVAIDLILQVAS